MSKISDTQNKTYGSIAALQTIVNAYPTLNLINSILGMFQTTSPILFILHILRILGITKEEIINWLARLLAGVNLFEDKEEEEEKEEKETNTKVSDGILDSIEYAIKGLLFLNIKDLFCGCQIEPFIPEWMLSETNNNSNNNSNVGISIPIQRIDMFGMLYNCPVNELESIYYFDTKPNIFGFNYTPNNVCNSTDFNAFLWHVINKSDSNGNIWDNRNFVKRELLSDTKYAQYMLDTLPEQTNYDGCAKKYFDFSINEENRKNPSKIRLTDNNYNTFYYKPILKCQYINSGSINDGGSLIKVTIPRQEYTRKLLTLDIDIPKTIFEFNYDYIFGLKLFESKTLVANVLNAILGLSTSIQIQNPISISRNLIRNEVRKMVQNMVAMDEEDFNGICATSFSNDEYNQLLNNSNTYINNNGMRTPNSEDVEKIFSQVKKLEYSSTLDEDLAKLLNTMSEIIKPIEVVDYSVNFTFDLSFIYALIEELMVEIVLQIMTPKVMMLYYINTCVMNGAVDNFQNWGEFAKMFKSPYEFIQKFNNLLKSMIKQIIDILIKQLLQFLIEKLTPLIKIFVMELLLETIRDYKDLITLILQNCTIPIPMFNIGTEALQIDNVNYADIVPVLEAPNNDC